MSDTTDIIQRPAGETFVVIRESYLGITDGDKSAAILLSWAEQWYKYKLKARAQARAVNAAKQAHGEPADQDEGLWIYRSTAEIASEDLLGTLSDKTVAKKMELLEELGYIKRRNNPTQPYDRKLQYLFIRTKVQAAVDAWAAQRKAPDLDPEEKEEGRGQENTAQAEAEGEEEKTPTESHSEKVPDGSGSEGEVHSEKVPDEDGTSSNTNRKNFRMNKEIHSIASSLESEEEEVAPASTASPSPETSSSLEASPEELLEALLDQAEGGQQAEGQIDQPEGHQAPSLPDHSDLADVPTTDQESEPTAGEQVPGGAAAPADPAEMERAVNREIDTLLTNRWLRAYGYGDDKKPPLISERPKGIDRKRVAKLLTLDTLDELVRAAQADEPPFATALLRRLDEVASRAQSPASTTETASSLRPGNDNWQVGDRVLYRGKAYEIVEVTRVKYVLELLSDRLETEQVWCPVSPNTFRALPAGQEAAS